MSFGINYIYPIFETFGILFSLQSICTHRSEMPHFATASGQDIYSIVQPPFPQTLSI